MTKGDLMKFVLSDEEQGYCDTAIPMHLWEGIDTSIYCYDNHNYKLINLAERYFLQRDKIRDRLLNKVHKAMKYYIMTDTNLHKRIEANITEVFE